MAPASGGGPQTLSGGQRVRVVTDLFEAEIDTVGGDLRQVGLRTYPDSVRQRNQPFLLLKDSGPDLFIAQSGLVALNDGPAPNHYAPLIPEQMEYRLADTLPPTEHQVQAAASVLRRRGLNVTIGG